MTDLRLLNPYKIIFKAIAIVVLSLLIGLIIPGLAALKGRVFYESTMIPKLPKDALKKIEIFKNEKAKIVSNTIRIDDSLVNHLRGNNLNGYINAELYFQNRLKNDKPPIQVMPFYLNPIMLVWVFMYASLGWLLIIFSPSNDAIINKKKDFYDVLISAICIYIMYQWTVWMRNFALSNESRVVYSFANYDIAPVSFIFQEFNTFLFAILLAIVWKRWIAYFKICRNEGLSQADVGFQTSVMDVVRIEKLSKTYIHWQISSIVLALGFIDFSSAFWDLIIRKHDSRYLIAGLTIHSFWALTWIIISLPLIVRWYNWSFIKNRAIREILSADNNFQVDAQVRLDTVKSLSPFGFWNVATSGSVALLSFVLPIFQAFFKI